MANELVFGIAEYEPFADDLCRHIGGERGVVKRHTFPDGERYQRLRSHVADRDVVLVGGTITAAATLALYDLSWAIVRYGARRLTLVVPYFGYSTMERAVHPGEVVTAKTRARLLSSIPPASHGNRMLLLDLHSEGLPHYFEGDCTARHVYAKRVIQSTLRAVGGDEFVLGSTDTGRAEWVESLASDLSVDAAIISKIRESGESTRVVSVRGLVDGRSVVIFDDMIRSGSSLIHAARAYLDAGAKEVAGVCTHGIFPGDSFEKLLKTKLFTKIVATDSHPRVHELVDAGLEIVPVAKVFAPYFGAK